MPYYEEIDFDNRDIICCGRCAGTQKGSKFRDLYTNY